MAYYSPPQDPVWLLEEIRMLENTDPANAREVFNPLIQQILECIAYVYRHRAVLDESGKVPASQLPEMNYDQAGTAALVQQNLSAHAGNQDNPHGVTAAQVGLDKVPNVETNAQTPTYTLPEALAPLASGERLDAAFGKLALAVAGLLAHLADQDNPHRVTAVQAGALPAQGTAKAAEKLAQAHTIRANLASVSAPGFDGTRDITPGVTGVLPAANGGTGKSSLPAGAALIGNGAGEMGARAITNHTSISGSLAGNTNLITLRVAAGTGCRALLEGQSAIAGAEGEQVSYVSMAQTTLAERQLLAQQEVLDGLLAASLEGGGRIV